jgi:manganese transport protein
MPSGNSVKPLAIREPPRTFFGKLKLLGPGFILSASIVGSGELIATTTLGASAGFAAFWIIIISCLMKVTVQLEFGKHTILTGETAMQSFNKLPGPRFGKGKWMVWTILSLFLLKFIQLGGMIGGTAIVLNMLLPSVAIYIWVFFAGLLTSALIYKGYYFTIEKFSLFMVAMFTILTLASVFALQFTDFDFSLSEVINGQQYNLSGPIVGIAIGAVGITGVASDEIIAYNYWCLEKGYAAFTGPEEENEDWRRRAKGWINVMYLDAFLAMIIYTLVTAAFYLLGAAVLHDKGIVPEGNQLIETVAYIYTETLGPGIRTTYLVGAFFVLYSSLFASLAAWTRIYPDIFGQLQWVDVNNNSKRKTLVAWIAWIAPVLWACTYLFIKLPVFMILSGGFVGSFLLFIVVYAVLQFRYNRRQIFKPGLLYDTMLWISVASIVFVGIFGLVRIL